MTLALTNPETSRPSRLHVKKAALQTSKSIDLEIAGRVLAFCDQQLIEPRLRLLVEIDEAQRGADRLHHAHDLSRDADRLGAADLDLEVDLLTQFHPLGGVDE